MPCLSGQYEGAGPIPCQTEFALTWGQPPLVTFSDTFSVAASVFPWRRREGVREGNKGSLQTFQVEGGEAQISDEGAGPALGSLLER